MRIFNENLHHSQCIHHLYCITATLLSGMEIGQLGCNVGNEVNVGHEDNVADEDDVGDEDRGCDGNVGDENWCCDAV